ncbi:helix-turn-helix domain-containing protein [Cohnella yongneupensis]|uniref:AraC family transcriptional regulator n=1 Tax=Cohnella yongneupensis TaxID=425006 RepID=A0ABW0R101_9BACL
MDFSQQELDAGNALLNRHAANVRGRELSFYVHYWGGEKRLYTNHLHKHSFFEICYVAEGEGQYEEGSRTVPLTNGTLFMSRPNLKHQILSDDGLNILFVAFELIHSESSEEAIVRYSSLEKSESFLIERAAQHPSVILWQALLKQAVAGSHFIQDGIVGLSGALLAAFEGAFADERTRSKQAASSASSSTLVHRAKLFIRDNLSQELSLSSVADNLHVSSRHLSRLFAEELGQSYSNYVRQERIRQAVVLLSSTDLSIKTVAEETGFDTVHYFTTVFKSEMGEPPGQFIKRLKEQTDIF